MILAEDPIAETAETKKIHFGGIEICIPYQESETGERVIDIQKLWDDLPEICKELNILLDKDIRIILNWLLSFWDNEDEHAIQKIENPQKEDISCIQDLKQYSKKLIHSNFSQKKKRLILLEYLYIFSYTRM